MSLDEHEAIEKKSEVIWRSERGDLARQSWGDQATTVASQNSSEC